MIINSNSNIRTTFKLITITTALAFCWLAEQQVDVAVIEVGLGGLLDATNIVNPALTVITNIGLDHTDLLGHTLAEIAVQKAGIMKPGVPCVIGESNPETTPVFLRRAKECGILGEGLETTDCHLWFADQCEFLRRQRLRHAPDCELHGDYQQRNLQTAYVALCALNQLSISQSSINCQLSIVQLSINLIQTMSGRSSSCRFCRRDRRCYFGGVSRPVPCLPCSGTRGYTRRH